VLDRWLLITGDSSVVADYGHVAIAWLIALMTIHYYCSQWFLCRCFHLFPGIVVFRVDAVCAPLLVLVNANHAFTQQVTVGIDHPSMVFPGYFLLALPSRLRA
jgi:hypothetical protein